jgi:hypothetical protein
MTIHTVQLHTIKCDIEGCHAAEEIREVDGWRGLPSGWLEVEEAPHLLPRHLCAEHVRVVTEALGRQAGGPLSPSSARPAVNSFVRPSMEPRA